MGSNIAKGRMPRRTAAVTGPSITAEKVEQYLPSNYRVVGTQVGEFGHTEVLISGIDVAGWTMDNYIIPRLGSGLYACRETTTEGQAS